MEDIYIHLIKQEIVHFCADIFTRFLSRTPLIQVQVFIYNSWPLRPECTVTCGH